MGYLMVDNRASGGRLREYDTVSCRHCQAVIRVLKGKQRQGGGWCASCAGPVCDACTRTPAARQGICESFARKVDEAVDRDERARQFAHFVRQGFGR